MKRCYNFKELMDVKLKYGFINGMMRVMDIGSTTNKQYHYKDTNNIDKDAMLSDWMVVGNDIRRAINDFRR